MKELNRIYNEDCFETMGLIADDKQKVDIILTSPPYNTGRPSTSERSRNNFEGRYDIHLDNMIQDDYCNWVVNVFNHYDEILKDNGVILWNVSYGSDATVNTESIGLMWLSIADIIRKTNFTVADNIIWKKGSALPNNVSKNKLTRICEYVFVFCRKNEYKTFNANKKISSVSSRGQTFYKNEFNYIEAKNNDGSCKLNKATFSSDLVYKLLNMYANNNSIVYDSFMGTGTTAIGCLKYGCNYIGSELSKEQCAFAQERIDNYKANNKS